MPLTKEDMQQITQAIKHGDIEVARFALQTSDDERAAGMLNRLNARYPPKQPLKVKPVNTETKIDVGRLIFFGLLAAIIIGGVIAVIPLISEMNAGADAINQAIESQRLRP